VVEGARLESVYRAKKLYREFESLFIRQFFYEKCLINI